MQQAVLIGYIRFNPADTCILPRVEKAKVTPCDDAQISPFIKEARGNRFEILFVVTLFTGVREGEILGLTWDCVDFDNGVLTINKQMQLHQDKDMKAYQLVPTKNSKAQTIITAAPFVMERLKHRKVEQPKERLLAAHCGSRADLYLQTRPKTTSQSRPYIEHLRELLHPLADRMRVFMT